MSISRWTFVPANANARAYGWNRNQKHLSLHAAGAVALLLAACSEYSPAVPSQQGVSVVVSPSSARVGPNERVSLTATVTGTAETSVDWSVQEGIAGGAVDVDGRYTAPTATGTFHVVAASRADPMKTAAAIVTVVGTPPPANGAPMTTASRTSGVAPFAVFLDAVDTASEGSTWPFAWRSGVWQPADMEGAHFSWDFGDLAAGVWTHTGRSRNGATGYTAAHVFEAPGTYTVTLTVTDTAGNVSTYKQSITVTAFAGETRYASAAGTGDGSSESTPSSLAAGAAWLNAGSSRRLLLKRGDRFAIPTIELSYLRSGLTIGAYGTSTGDNRPVISFGTNGRIYVGSTDTRIMDLDLVGPGPANDPGTGAVEFAAHLKADNGLVLRVRTSNFRTGLGNSTASNLYADPHDGLAWVDNEVAGAGVIGLYTGGRRVAVMGCSLHDTGSHNLRVFHAVKGVVSNNRLWGETGDYQHSLKLHAPEGAGRPETRWVTVTDNLAMINAPWTFSIGPENAQTDERVSHVVVERNRTWGDPTTRRNRTGIEISARHVMVRNNVLDGTGGSASGYAGALVQRRGIEPPPLAVRFLNNTVVRRDPVSEFHGVDLDTAGSEGIIVRNNIAWAPSGGTRSMVDGAATSLAVSDNLDVARDPLFTDPAAGDFALRVGSPGVDAGAELPDVLADYLGASRGRGAGFDLGAFESL